MFLTTNHRLLVISRLFSQVQAPVVIDWKAKDFRCPLASSLNKLANDVILNYLREVSFPSLWKFSSFSCYLKVKVDDEIDENDSFKWCSLDIDSSTIFSAVDSFPKLSIASK
ncbi:hypothetical protein AVEN_210151-1 [Araneus ventricosus]|uniref:Reverse transcriptase domain-containing protein n=1 Tax=Araneus ventricosus TaxID=182803 RepID=A0A4Y2PY35_ARAVE|nr:hypothetical protein AVEN_210151-1 [Araneus ventricosus]